MQRRHLAVLAVLVVGMFIAPSTFAGAPVDRATGGGQIFASADPSGAGDTIGFTAQNLESSAVAARGQVQVIDRPGHSTRFHGVVDCLRVSETFAEIGGVIRQTNTRFTVFVVDTDQGGPQTGNEMITFVHAGDTTCNTGDNTHATTYLARGNAQVYNN